MNDKAQQKPAKKKQPTARESFAAYKSKIRERQRFINSKQLGSGK